MKNKFIENKKRAAKRYAKKWHRKLNQHGHYLPHCYSKSERKKLAWWDDVFFKMGSQVVAVWWVHPRQHYYDLCENHTFSLMPLNLNDGRVKFKPSKYKKLGKSRKKAILFQTVELPVHEIEKKQQYWQQYETKFDEVLLNNDFVVQPFMQIKQYDWCIGVDLCLPIEALDEMSVNEMAHIAKKLLRRETTLAELYPNYVYTKENWIAENPFQAA